MTSDRWRRWRTIATRTLIILGGLAALVVLVGLASWWNFTTSTERVTGDLREIHRELEFPETWHYVGEEVRGTPECLMGSCLHVTRRYISDLPPEEPDACPWARTTVEQWGTVVPRNYTGPGCSFAAHNGAKRLVVSVSVDMEPHMVMNGSPPPSERPQKSVNVLSVQLQCCR